MYLPIDTMKIALYLLIVYATILVGWIWREDEVKKTLMEEDLDFPHLRYLFGMFGAVENPAFRDTSHFALMFPAIRQVECWNRLIGPFWIKMGARGMTDREVAMYHQKIHDMVEDKYEQMGIGKAQKSPEHRIP